MNNVAQYAVRPTAAPVLTDRVDQVATGVPPSRVAVFMAHGMGQQIPFETLDSIAQALVKYDKKMLGDDRTNPSSTSVKYDKLRLPRIELHLKDRGDGIQPVDVDVYEAYWAPLTEGKIKARGVMAFLSGAGANGLKIARGRFRRWLFGEYHHFPTPFRNILYLLIALAAVGALVVLNSAIAAVAAARTLLGQSPAWLTPGLFADLTTTFNAVVTAMMVFGISLAISHNMRRLGLKRPLRVFWGWVTAAEFTLALFTIVLAGLAVILLFYLHLRAGVAANTQLWPQIFPTARIPRFNLRFGFWTLWLASTFAGVRILWTFGELAIGFLRDITERRAQRNNAWLTIGLTALFVLLIVLVVWLATAFARSPSPGSDASGFGALIPGLGWPVFWIGVAWAVNVVLGYARDVAPKSDRGIGPYAIARIRRWWRPAITIVSVFLFAFTAVFAYRLLHNGQVAGGAGYENFQRAVAWPLLIAFSAFARGILVQFVGDVAIYVMPYKLDAFNDLRKEIKETVYNVAHAVYALSAGPEGEAAPYEKIVVVGHSLGSVIAYDALNRLILEDIDSDGGLHVAERTALFLTFGSPLDKTAFIFGAQGHGTTEAREALVAAVQPLIQNYRYRPRKWINIYSPWDIISGSLDLYDLPTDPPSSKDPKAVCNQSDPDATTLLMAHTEYWTNELLVKTLYNAL